MVDSLQLEDFKLWWRLNQGYTINTKFLIQYVPQILQPRKIIYFRGMKFCKTDLESISI